MIDRTIRQRGEIGSNRECDWLTDERDTLLAGFCGGGPIVERGQLGLKEKCDGFGN